MKDYRTFFGIKGLLLKGLAEQHALPRRPKLASTTIDKKVAQMWRRACGYKPRYAFIVRRWRKHSNEAP